MHVQKQPEPLHFFEKVQKKGEKFLLQYPDAKGKDLKPYWRAVIPDLHHAYSGICAYTCHWIPFDTGSPTVNHFKPKEAYPKYAYQWDNYRLVCGMLNGRKSNYEDVLDPFTLQDGWFEMHFNSLQLMLGQQLMATEAEKVRTTIKRLKLNDSMCIQGRKSWLVPYLKEKYPISHLEEKAPFLAKELKRQELDNANLPRWEEYRN
jgi:hypothetical protein